MNKIKLGDVLDFKRGMSAAGEFYSSAGRYIRLTLGNFSYPECGFKLNTSKDNLYYTGEVKEEFIMKKGDIITPLTEQVRGLLGNTATIPEDNLYIQTQDIAKLIPIEGKIDKRFAYYLVSSPIVKKQLDAGSQQTKIRHTSPDKLKDCYAYIPEDITVQKKIAKMLDFINEKIDINNKINSELESMVKSLYDYWFLQFEFPNECGRPYKSSGGKMVWSEELKRNIPEGWMIKKLSDIVKLGNDEIYDGPAVNTIDLSVMPCASISLNGINVSSNFGTNLYKMKKGDILFGSIRPYLKKAGIAPCDGAFAGTLHNFRCLDDRFYNFVLMTLTHENMFDYAVKKSKGTKMPVVGSDSLMDYPVVFNAELVEKFNQMDIKSIICGNVMQNQELSALRDYMLPLLMSGQISIK